MLLAALRLALAGAWLGPEGGRPEAATLRKLLSAACAYGDAAVRAAAASTIPAVMAGVSRLAASGLSQVRAAKPLLACSVAQAQPPSQFSNVGASNCDGGSGAKNGSDVYGGGGESDGPDRCGGLGVNGGGNSVGSARRAGCCAATAVVELVTPIPVLLVCILPTNVIPSPDAPMDCKSLGSRKHQKRNRQLPSVEYWERRASPHRQKECTHFCFPAVQRNHSTLQ